MLERMDALVSETDDDGRPIAYNHVATHRVPLSEAPHMYDVFQRKQDGAIKVVLQP